LDLSQFSLDGKVALITGASQGIGRATAIAFSRAGASVVLASRKLPDLEEVAAEIRKKGGESLAVPAHVGHIDQLDNLVNQATANFGKVDILVNNAGISPVYTPCLDMEERAWDVIMNVNLKGLFFLSQKVARVMKEHGKGVIINVASTGSFRPEPNSGVYAISKAAVAMATKVMALEWAVHNIRINAIAPGMIKTRLVDAMWDSNPESKEVMIGQTLLGRIGEPEEIANAMILLASDASSYATGQIFVIDGGYLLK